MLLRTERLTKDYGTFRALDGLDLTVQAGEIFGLLGPNGSGKTTALRLFLGFLQPTLGAAWIDGHHTWRDDVAARRRVAYLPGELRLYENMTGRRLVQFLCKLRGQPAQANSEELAQRFDINLDRPLAELSSGMKRKVALLQVLVPDVPLLILDEPTNALDPTMRDELLMQLRRERERGKAVVFSSHVLSEVERVCDRVGILQHGKLVHLQDLKELQQGRVVHVRFHSPLAGLPSLEGLKSCGQNDGAYVLEHTGPLPPLLDWLAHQQVLDMRMEPMGLHGIYHRYHGPEY
jgi:ABC-2 type transport system ATP-binding protein